MINIYFTSSNVIGFSGYRDGSWFMIQCDSMNCSRSKRFMNINGRKSQTQLTMSVVIYISYYTVLFTFLTTSMVLWKLKIPTYNDQPRQLKYEEKTHCNMYYNQMYEFCNFIIPMLMQTNTTSNISHNIRLVLLFYLMSNIRYFTRNKKV